MMFNKRTILLALLVGVFLFGVLYFSSLNNIFATNKVTICHATGSATNPYVTIHVSANATAGHFDNNGTPNAGHEDDLLLQGEVDCPTNQTPTPDPTPTLTCTPAVTITQGARVTPTDTPSVTPTDSVSPTPSVTETPTNTPDPTGSVKSWQDERKDVFPGEGKQYGPNK